MLTTLRKGKFRRGHQQEWTDVTLPHSYTANEGHDGSGTYYRGTATYATEFDLNSLESNMFLRVGAASLVARVSVNGSLVGEHKGGFGAFCFDLTDTVHIGTNQLTIETDNTFDPNVTPLNGDFNVNGGLYRDVTLFSKQDICISPMDDGSSGVYITTNSDGTVNVKVVILNKSGETAQPTLKITLFNGDQKKVARGSAKVVATEGQSTAELTLKVKAPRVWDGVHDPYMYRCLVELFYAGQRSDKAVEYFGFRSFHVDPEQGLILNGKPYSYHGVNFHQGRPKTGWAATQGMQEQDFKLVAEIGCTGIRMAHYQHAKYEHELADRQGLVTWAELALVNQMSDTPEFKENCRQQLRELIKQNYNHPSILFWSIYNEPWIDKVKGEKEWEFLRELVDLSHELDPTRLVTGAVVGTGDHWMNWCLDATAINRYWGWYDAEPSEWEANLVKLREEAGGRSFGIAEYGAGGSAQHHESPPKRPQTTDRFHPEEYQCLVHEAAWNALKDKPWIWCKLIWVMFDFAVAARSEGDTLGMNDKGLVTGDRKVKKDVFYFYKANWSKELFAHICESRYNPRQVGTYQVKVYSNCSQVELFVNGVSRGKKQSDRVFIWPDIHFDSTTNLLAIGDRDHEDSATITMS